MPRAPAAGPWLVISAAWLEAGNLDVEAKAPHARCDECPLRERPFVAGWGPLTTDRVIVGEAPGETEVAEGKPFVGRAGRRLDTALVAVGVDRFTISVTNTVLCHPIGNDSPPPREAISACHERLIREIRQRTPRKVMALAEPPPE